jgi:ABC-type multidrug transport system fused ATPase/permease subunit
MAKRPGRRGNDDDTDAGKKLTRKDLVRSLRIFSYLKPYRGLFLVGLLLLLISGGITMVFPKVTGNLVDAATGAATHYDRNTIALSLIGILLVQAIFSFLRVVVFAQVSERALRDLRTDLYQKLIALPMPFFEKRRVGELTSRITGDVAQLQDVLAFTLAEFIRQITTLIIGICVIAVTSTKLTLVMLSTFPVMMVGAVIFGKFIRKMSRQVTDELGAANTVAEETLQGIQTVKSFTAEAWEANRYGSHLGNIVSLALKAAKYRGVFISFVIFSIFGAIVLVLWYGLGLVAAGDITIGSLISFIIYTTFIGAAAGGLGDLYSQLQKTAGASERILEILEQPSEVYPYNRALQKDQPDAGIVPAGRATGHVVFDEVNFSYPTRPDLQVLNGMHLEMRPGEVTALAGQSGAGKSTIVQLLMRFHHPTAGRILLDGFPIENLDVTWLRSQIGIVPQDVLLFGGSIEENIRYGKPDATLEEVRNAARRANALSFIDSFPEGLQTVVGERGIKLSGGQRQRIAIARAMLKDPAILVLDEATNSLDAESEKLVQDALQELMRGRTTLVIAHRLNTIREADQILVVAKGEIAEAGTHAELSDRPGGQYRNLLRIQTREHELVKSEE